MFQTAPGVHIPNLERLEEKFELTGNSLAFNISFEKLDPLVRTFIDQIEAPCFLILHIPATKSEEEALHDASEDAFHERVYYLDGLSKAELLSILDEFGALFLRDGMNKFGVASHMTRDELFIQKYKVVSIWSTNIQKYIPLLEAFGVTQTDELITPWQLFSESSPGECTLVEADGLNIYRAVERLEQQGLHFAKMVAEA